MKLIILSGKPNTGKTTTLNKVFDVLTKGMNPPPVKNLIEPGGDFESAFLYKGKRVAIFSHGDTLWRIREAICTYAAHCDVLILAYSDKHKYDHKPNLFNLAREKAGDVQECVITKGQKDTLAAAADDATCQVIIDNI
jgi:hypothetical protein